MDILTIFQSNEILFNMIIAFAGGILPALLWLFFWLLHDDENPEPKKLIFACFTLGLLLIPIAYYAQSIFNHFFLTENMIQNVFLQNYLLAIFILVFWSFIEEVLKYVAAYFGGLSKPDNDEPIDPMIYLITAALGFAAGENILYLLHQISYSGLTQAFQVGSLRFVGSTLVHVSCSAIIGVFMGLSYYKNKKYKIRFLLTGFILSIALHTLFNSFIIRAEVSANGGIFRSLAYSIIWFVIVIIITMFERIKHKYKDY